MSKKITATTLFSGAGGFDTGMALYADITVAVNHNPESLATHALNFPGATHYETDITEADPLSFPATTILQASPECRYHTGANGKQTANQVNHDQQKFSFWTDREEDDPAERSRATMQEVVRWCAAKLSQNQPYQLVFVENVPEVNLWGGYSKWWDDMQSLGYQGKAICFNSMFAPAYPAACHESRDRWYAVFWRDGQTSPDLDIQPGARCHRCNRQIAAHQVWKSGKAYGAYREQYLYLCPKCDRAVVPFHRTAREVLDWSLPVPTIGQRKHALVENTMKGISKGLERYRSTHKAFIYSYYGNACYSTLDEPLGTVTTVDRHALITIPHAQATIEECGYRMVKFPECLKAMGYPETFKFACKTQKEMMRQIGLSVTPAVAAMLVQRGIASLA